MFSQQFKNGNQGIKCICDDDGGEIGVSKKDALDAKSYMKELNKRQML